MPNKENETYTTLDRFLIQRQRTKPEASGELTQVILQMGVVAKIISNYMRRAALEGLLVSTGETNVHGETVKKLDRLGNEVFIKAFEYVDIVGALISEENEQPVTISSGKRRGKYVVLVDPIDGSSNLEVDCVIGSIFSVRSLEGSMEASIRQKGTRQIAAGYIMYGTATLLIYSAGDGVHSFVLDEQIGEFVLDHANLRMPGHGKNVSANFGYYRRWPAFIRSFADHICLEGDEGRSLRYSGALVADMHQILHCGGIYFYPQDDRRHEGKLRLLYECAPLAMIAEQAGGAATTGTMRVLDVVPDEIHQRIPFAVGSRSEVQKYQDACC
jgi:fructose-1,6-bisphosphatase I